MSPDLSELETLFLALGDKTRLRLLALMADEPVTVGYLCDSLGDSQPKVSRHLAYLRNSGVVTTRRDGKNIYYGLRNYDDTAIEGVVECVLAALNGGPHVKQKGDARKVGSVRPKTERPRREAAESVRVAEELDQIAPIVEAYDAEPEYEYEPEPTYESDYEEPSEEMDVFLL